MNTARTKATKVWAALILCAVVAACSTRRGDQERESASAPASATPAESAGIPLDLASVMRRAHYRFKPDGDGFRAQQSGYDARISAAGVLSVAAAPTTKPLVLATLASATGHPVLARDGGVDIKRDRCVTEHAVGDEQGIEQSWVYDCAPTAGDVVVRLAASGAAFDASDAQGLLFRDGQSPAIRYGLATWVDARGVRTSVRPEWADGMITLRVPAEVVRRTAFPATLDPLVGAEFELDKYVNVTGPSAQDHSAVAFNGTSYLVVWEDRRGGGGDIYGARVNPDTGEVLKDDESGVPIAVVDGNQQLPAVASNGTDFFVVWEDFRAGSPRIFGARVTGASGEVVAADAGGFALGGGGGVMAQRAPAVDWDGTHYFVVWEDSRIPGSDIYGLRVGPDGKPLTSDAAGIAINTAMYGQLRPRVKCDGLRCLVVWADNRQAQGQDPTGKYDVRGARVVSATGAVLDAEPSSLGIAAGPNAQTNPDLAYDPGTGNYLVTWDDFAAIDAQPDIAGRRIDATTGNFLEIATPIAIATGPQAQRNSAVAFDGANFLVTWTDVAAQVTIHAGIVKPDGSRVTAGAGVALNAPAPSAGASAVAARKTGGFFATWTELATNAPAEVHGTRVNPASGAALDAPAVLTGHANAEHAPAVATDGKEYFVVWEDWRNASPGDVFGVRVLPNGTVHAGDEAGVLIAQAAPRGSSSAIYHVEPAVAYGGGTYLVAWTDRRPAGGGSDAIVTAAYALRVSPSTGRPVAADTTGVRVSPAPPLATAQTAPVLAFSGDTFLAAWRDRRNGPDNVYVRPIKAGGATLTLGDETRVGLGPRTSTVPSIASDGAGTFLVAWMDTRDDIQALAFAARVDAAGKVKAGDENGFRVSQVTANQISPSAAWTGSEFFVAWEDHRSHGAQGEIFGRRIPLTGAPTTDDIPIAAGAGGHRENPVVVNALDGAAGGNLQVVWRDDRSGQWDLYGSLVSATGLVREPKGLALALEPGSKGAPSLAAFGDGKLLLAYSRLDPARPFRVERARARILETGISKGTCTKDDDCATRFCTDGVCCSERCDAPCRTCGTGTCTVVANAQDDQCTGTSSCSATGVCQRANGQPCEAAGQCASGVCDADDGVCCDRACPGACNSCKTKEKPGICTVSAGGTVPQECVPFACDGKDEQCPTKCESDIACARPNVCLGGKCEPLLASTCIDNHTIKAPSGLVTDCKPYACAGAACVSPCKSVQDCVSGFVCDVDGTCVEPPKPADPGGCSCQTTTSTPSGGHLAWLLGALLALRRRSRRPSRA